MVLARVEGFPAPRGPLDLVLDVGDVVRLTGSNGSGKTSLLRCLAGLDAPLQARRVLLDGGDPAAMPAARLAGTVAMVHQHARDGLVGLTTWGEHRFRGRPVPPGLPRQDIATLSSGEARRLAIGLASAPLVLLDEPTEGLDARGLRLLRARIAAASRHGCVVFVDHEATLADLATAHVALDEAPPPTPWELPGPGPLVLDVPAQPAPHGVVAPRLQARAGLHAIVGPNGSGKTTLLHHIAMGRGPATVAGSPAGPGRVRWLSPRAEDHLRGTTVEQELHGVEDLGLVPRAWHARHPLHLSGGQRKRVALAKVLGVPASAYLLDEPEAHMDGEGRELLQAAIARRIEEGSALIVATHDAHLIAAAHDVTRLQVRA